MPEANETTDKLRFAIFRGRDGKNYSDEGPMYSTGEMPAAMLENYGELQAAGFDRGASVRLLFSTPGLSLTYIWFKSGFPLPRHSHNADCVYYIIAGSLRIGTEELGPGDGFFLGVDAPYTYTPGPSGVELLEFRNADRFDIQVFASNPAFWAKAIADVAKRREAWATEPQPSAPWGAVIPS